MKPDYRVFEAPFQSRQFDVTNKGIIALTIKAPLTNQACPVLNGKEVRRA
jgi:hypothetical protein